MSKRQLKPVTLLKRARALIEDPKHWTQGAYARNKSGKPVDADSPAAERFCALGALDRVGAGGRAEVFLYKATRGNQHGVSWVNDGYLPGVSSRLAAHNAVLRIYDRAIEIAKQEAKRD